jgi:hypothetical protein
MTNYVVPVVTYYPGYSQQQVSQNLLYKTIASITNANPCVVTTVYPHHYIAPGMIVTFNIPSMFGMRQLNGIIAQVLALTSNTLTVNVDTTNFGVFAYPSPLPGAYTPPTVIPQASGAPLPLAPPFLPFGNENAFEGVIYNNGPFGDSVNRDQL